MRVRALAFTTLIGVSVFAGAARSGAAAPQGGRNSAVSSVDPSATDAPTQLAFAQQHIQHVIFIVQENRSFDQYFGTYPGADGIPMKDGVPTVCIPDPVWGSA